MTYRSTLSGLVTRVRELVYDTGGVTFTNDQVAAALDQNRVSRNNLKLRSEYAILPTNLRVYREHFADLQYWESNAVLRTENGSTLTPDAGPGLTDYLLGYFYFSSGQNPPVYIDGRTYDVYGASVLLLEEWVAQHKDEFDFLSGGAVYGQKGAMLGQVYNQYLSLIREYKNKMAPQSVTLMRPDANARVR